MFDECEACGLKFEREQGYFLGAMYISYGLALISILVFSILLWIALQWSIERVVIWAVILFLPFAPPLTCFARVLWLHLDWAIDPIKD